MIDIDTSFAELDARVIVVTNLVEGKRDYLPRDHRTPRSGDQKGYFCYTPLIPHCRPGVYSLFCDSLNR